MNHESSFPDPLELRLHSHRNGSAILQLTHYFRYCNPLYPIITVPTGFLTDGASIPRLFWNILGPHGPWFRAAVVHDFLYNPKSTQHFPGIDRRMADSIFLEAMKDCGVGWLSRTTIFTAVRSFGWLPYKRRP